MSKKPTTKNVIENLNLDIDYDKLAEAIVRAQTASEEQKSKGKKTRRSVFRFLNAFAFVLMAVLFIAGIVLLWTTLIGATVELWVRIFATAALLLMAIIAFLCFNESLDDNYQDSIVLFTTLVSLVALIVAVIALIKA
ncbi:MAG: hypothetical protein IKG85_07350 [Clostridia bacterium]|nr:hypothetical protein [Clostridia bacterium]